MNNLTQYSRLVNNRTNMIRVWYATVYRVHDHRNSNLSFEKHWLAHDTYWYTYSTGEHLGRLSAVNITYNFLRVCRYKPCLICMCLSIAYFRILKNGVRHWTTWKLPITLNTGEFWQLMLLFDASISVNYCYFHSVVFK